MAFPLAMNTFLLCQHSVDLLANIFYHHLMETQILYAGDTSLTTAASYLAGVMKNFGLKFDYIPSGVRMPEHLLQTPRRLYILSDYSASDIPEFCTQTILHNVRAGAGLLMLGGWESY